MREWRRFYKKTKNGSLELDEQDLLLDVKEAIDHYHDLWLQKFSHILDESNDNDEQK